MKKFLLGVVAFALAGCASAQYTPPSTNYDEDFVRVVDKNKDVVWSALIDHVSSAFFSIENFEKDSGLLTLKFGSANPAEFVDCGTWQAQNLAQTYTGPYVDYVAQNGGQLDGVMNINVKSISKNKTRVRVKARYILSHSGVAGAGIYATRFRNVWSFDSGNTSTTQVQNAAPGISPMRTCGPTYKAEKSILDAVERLAE